MNLENKEEVRDSSQVLDELKQVFAAEKLDTQKAQGLLQELSDLTVHPESQGIIDELQAKLKLPELHKKLSRLDLQESEHEILRIKIEFLFAEGQIEELEEEARMAA